MTYIPMIDPATGTVDTLAISQRAPLRAASEWRGPNYPPKYLRDAIEWLMLRAEAESRQWRRDRGLPVDTEMVTITAFGREVSGVRWSDF